MPAASSSINGILGIAHFDIAANTLGALSSPDGAAVYDVVKDASTFNDRDPVYWNAGSSQATSTSGGNTFMGLALGGAVTGAGTVRLQFMGLASVTEHPDHRPADQRDRRPG